MRTRLLLAAAALAGLGAAGAQSPAATPPGSRVLSFYANGQLASEREYRDGLKVGRHRGFWENGRPRFDLGFKDGKPHGLSRTWYEDGRLFESRNYVEGEEEGPQRMFEPDGRLRANYEVREGRRYGVIGSRPCATVRAKR